MELGPNVVQKLQSIKSYIQKEFYGLVADDADQDGKAFAFLDSVSIALMSNRSLRKALVTMWIANTAIDEENGSIFVPLYIAGKNDLLDIESMNPEIGTIDVNDIGFDSVHDVLMFRFKGSIDDIEQGDEFLVVDNTAVFDSKKDAVVSPKTPLEDGSYEVVRKAPYIRKDGSVSSSSVNITVKKIG
jgi:hypothetical protein